jgi:hypothetical protein
LNNRKSGAQRRAEASRPLKNEAAQQFAGVLRRLVYGSWNSGEGLPQSKMAGGARRGPQNQSHGLQAALEKFRAGGFGRKAILGN